MDTKIIIIIVILLGVFFMIYKIDTFTPAVITQLNARGGMDEKLTGFTRPRLCYDPLYKLDLPLKKTQEPLILC